jgi:8-oxo-dGTP pyrophosphatase MutT (NUDIX family)
VWRRGPGGDLEVLAVHRPRYDDWSLPKGKLEDGESDAECALREVEEETGLSCRLEEELPSTRYRDRHDREKLVRYWAMRPLEGSFSPRREVDEVKWISPGAASDLLSYSRDAEVVAAFAAGRSGVAPRDSEDPSS